MASDQFEVSRLGLVRSLLRLDAARVCVRATPTTLLSIVFPPFFVTDLSPPILSHWGQLVIKEEAVLQAREAQLLV